MCLPWAAASPVDGSCTSPAGDRLHPGTRAGIQEGFDVIGIVLAPVAPVEGNRDRQRAREGLATVLLPRLPADRLLIRAAPLADDAAVVEHSVELVRGERHRQERECHAWIVLHPSVPPSSFRRLFLRR
jgi:hypothetical protein